MKKLIYAIAIFGLAFSQNAIFADNTSDSEYSSDLGISQYELSELVDQLAREAQEELMKKLDVNLEKKLNQKIVYDEEELEINIRFTLS